MEIGDEVEETTGSIKVTDEEGSVVFEKEYDPEVTKVGAHGTLARVLIGAV